MCCNTVNAGSPPAGSSGALQRLRAAVRGRTPVIAFVTFAAFVAVVFSHVDLADSDQPGLPRATVTVARDAAVRPIPRSYLGLSTEYWTLPLYGSRLSLFERVLSLLRVPGDGPVVLRIGGDSADRVFWDPQPRGLPGWAFGVTPSWTTLLGKLVRRLGVRLILDLNVITSSPSISTTLAAAAEARLPRRSIIGFEIGNEPDIYRRSAWLGMAAEKAVDRSVLPAALTAQSYAASLRQYAALLSAVAPGVPLLGPALANPHAHADWITTLIASHPPDLHTVSAHRYVYSGCVHSRSSRYPTIARLLSQRATAGMAASLSGVVHAAHRAGLSFRLTELNSVNCGGRPGLSDAFATALWAPSALFDLLAAGVDGVNVHTRADTINAPFALTSAGLIARPLLYGLLMFVRTLGSRPQLVAVRLHAGRSSGLEAWAVRTAGDRLHVLLINEGRRSVRVRLTLPARGRAAIERLLAPSARSLTGVTLDGQRLAPDGRWQGTPSDETVAPTRHGYVVSLPTRSAALLIARLAPGALVRELPRPV